MDDQPFVDVGSLEDVPRDGEDVLEESPVLLDAYQRAAVAWRKGEAVVAAGAGSGKTTLIVERAADLVVEAADLVVEGVTPSRILCLAFNTKAAEELDRRIARRLGMKRRERGAVSTVEAVTFHAWGYRILREWWPGQAWLERDRIVGTEKGPVPWRIARKALDDIGAGKNEDVDLFLELSSMVRNRLVDLDADDAERQVDEAIDTSRPGMVAEFCLAYQRRKQDEQCLDFTDMVYYVAMAMKKGWPVAEALRTRYDHVMVDEAQDEDVARMFIAQYLGSGAKSLFMVADLRQAINSFAGADFKHILRRLDAGATLFSLPVNRRSGSAIVEYSNRIASGHDWHLGGDCKPKEDAAEGQVLVVPESGIDWIVADLQARLAGGLELKNKHGKPNVGILTRTNDEAGIAEFYLSRAKIKVKLLGKASDLWGTRIGKCFLSYLRLVNNVAGRKDLLRVYNRPTRYIKREKIEAVANAAFGQGYDPIDVLVRDRTGVVRKLGHELSTLRMLAWDVQCSRISGMLQETPEDVPVTARGIGEVEDRKAISSAIEEMAVLCGSLSGVEACAARTRERKVKGPAVVVGTIHRNKGLEYELVYVLDVSEGKLPHKYAIEEGMEAVDEERRLFYVAVTRAKSTCILTVEGNPSRFLREVVLDGRPATPD